MVKMESIGTSDANLLSFYPNIKCGIFFCLEFDFRVYFFPEFDVKTFNLISEQFKGIICIYFNSVLVYIFLTSYITL